MTAKETKAFNQFNTMIEGHSTIRCDFTNLDYELKLLEVGDAYDDNYLDYELSLTNDEAEHFFPIAQLDLGKITTPELIADITTELNEIEIQYFKWKLAQV